MERKNTVLLTVIAVATLLVAVVGATFAYFTATNTTDGKAGSVSATTAKVGGAKLTANTEHTYGSLSYPGGTVVTETSITVSKQNASGDSNDYDVTFNLGLKGQNQLESGQTLKWYLIRTHSPVTAISDISCSLKTVGNNNETQYSYTGCEASKYLAKFTDAELIGFGDVEGKGTDATSESLTTKGESDMSEYTDIADKFSTDGQKVLNLSGLKLSTSERANEKVYTKDYYYLIVEYPNQESSQNGTGNANMGKTISVTFDDISNIKAEIYKAS